MPIFRWKTEERNRKSMHIAGQKPDCTTFCLVTLTDPPFLINFHDGSTLLTFIVFLLLFSGWLIMSSSAAAPVPLFMEGPKKIGIIEYYERLFTNVSEFLRRIPHAL